MSAAKDIFLDALDFPAGDRTTFIDRCCGDDATLREKVNALLAAHSRADHVIKEPTVHTWNLDAATALPEAPGTMIGPYTIQKTLGEGGFGAVYLAQQDQPVKRSVALKLIRNSTLDKDVLRRFELERQALALMDHPGIAKVYDAGTTAAGTPYFAMEYVNGVSITEFCDLHRLTIRQRLELIEQVCRAVQHAHGRGVIHRDLKPSNILVSMLDGKPFPTIIDFGIAKAVHGGTHGIANPAITMPQQIIGTPQYMSPEQATISGEEGDIDIRADVYSLGSILYELVCGLPVFSAETLRNLRASELEKLICEQDPSPPSARTKIATIDKIAAARSTEPAKLPRLLQKDLDWICMRAIEKDRARRYPTAIALADDIGRYLRDEPVEACPPTLSYRAAKFAKRHRVEFAAGGAVVLALIAFTVGSAWFAVREHRAAVEAKRQLARANALNDFAQDILSGVDPAEARGMDTTLLRRILESSKSRVDSRLTDQPGAAASMLTAIAYAWYQIGTMPEAEKLLLQAIDKFKQSGDDDPAGLLTARELLASIYTDTGRFSEAEAMLKQVLEVRRKLNGESDRETLTTASNLATVYQKSGSWEQARVMFELLAKQREALLGPNHEDTLTSLNNLASSLGKLGQPEQAASILERVLRSQRESVGEDHPRTIMTMGSLATYYDSIGKSEHGIALLRQALAAKKRVYGPEHPSTLIGMDNLATALMNENKLDEADALFRTVIDVSEKNGPSRETRVIAINGRASIARARNDFVSAESLWMKSIEAAHSDVGDRHPVLVGLYSSLAGIRLLQGKIDDAAAAAQQAVDAAEISSGPRGFLTVVAHRAVAEVLAAKGDFAGAILLIEQSLPQVNPTDKKTLSDMNEMLARFHKKIAIGPASQPATQRAK